MTVPYAEVIGDPIAHSKSPLIQRHWLERLGIEADFRPVLVRPAALGDYLARRRADPAWRGCNVTIPHKSRIMPLLDRADDNAAAIGAVNCVIPDRGGMVGRNTDIDGIAAALAGAPIRGRKVAMVGAGGAALAAFRHFTDRGAGSIHLIVRDSGKASSLRARSPTTIVELHDFGRVEAAIDGAVAIVNASPLGMAGAPPMPQNLLAAIRAGANGVTLMDMVYQPVETEFLAAGRAGGGLVVDGLAMLIGQARTAFALFFGAPAPPGEDQLRDLLVTAPA